MLEEQRTAGEETWCVHYVDSDAGDAAKKLQELGGARVVLGTAPNAKEISAIVNGLSVNGKLYR